MYRPFFAICLKFLVGDCINGPASGNRQMQPLGYIWSAKPLIFMKFVIRLDFTLAAVVIVTSTTVQTIVDERQNGGSLFDSEHLGDWA